MNYPVQMRLAVAVGSLLAGAALGVGSAFTAFSAAGVSPVADQPGWQQRVAESQSYTLPYILGHYLADGQLPPPRSVMDLWRTTAGDGAVLRGDCLVTVEGEIPPARWWTLAAVNKEGVAEGPRAVLPASKAIIESDGRLVVRISSEPQPGNWIAPASDGSYALALTLHDPVLPLPAGVALPSLTRDGC